MTINDDTRDYYAPLIAAFIDECCEIGNEFDCTRDDKLDALLNIWLIEGDENLIEWATARELLVEAGVTFERAEEGDREYAGLVCDFEPEAMTIEDFNRQYGGTKTTTKEVDASGNLELLRSIDKWTDDAVAYLEATTNPLRRV